MPAPPKLCAEHERLAAFAGDWIGDEVVGVTPHFEPGAAKGFVSARMGLGGFYLMQDYRQERGGKTIFEGRALLTFDREDGRYKMFWHDSVGFVPEVPAVGHWGEDGLVFRQATLRGSARRTFRFEDPDTYSLRLQFSPDDEGWSDLLTATYRRAAPAA